MTGEPNGYYAHGHTWISRYPSEPLRPLPCAHCQAELERAATDAAETEITVEESAQKSHNSATE